MKLNIDIKNKFDDIDGKINFLIELCQMLHQENSELILKIKDLEKQLEQKNKKEGLFVEQETLIQSKIDGLLAKLNDFSNDISNNEY